ncbi:hypothetical protein B0J12DRAFT_122982 [Macrophomina phaseolina]|uniref:Uncharacterized protein n=1 Tax=Macrophomina phaseolina TaxID=35725 RepID=A0ABQ8G7S0_9PEZI|nr:hypothetical protein B0J12DRAFT_122982 [Macrophomina phaseolina]
MAPSVEALIGIVGLFVGLPPSVLVIWHCFRRLRHPSTDLEDAILVDDTEREPPARRAELRSNSYGMTYIARAETLLLLSGGVDGQIWEPGEASFPSMYSQASPAFNARLGLGGV